MTTFTFPEGMPSIWKLLARPLTPLFPVSASVGGIGEDGAVFQADEEDLDPGDGEQMEAVLGHGQAVGAGQRVVGGVGEQVGAGIDDAATVVLASGARLTVLKPKVSLLPGLARIASKKTGGNSSPGCGFRETRPPLPYETCQLGTSTSAGRRFLTDIVRERALGQFIDDAPVVGVNGLSDALGRLNQNYQVLKGQFGINNPQVETGRFSLRHELYRMRDASGEAWSDHLEKMRVADLWKVPEFRKFCRPFAPESAGAQPGLVIPFSTDITFGQNYFGLPPRRRRGIERLAGGRASAAATAATIRRTTRRRSTPPACGLKTTTASASRPRRACTSCPPASM